MFAYVFVLCLTGEYFLSISQRTPSHWEKTFQIQWYCMFPEINWVQKLSYLITTLCDIKKIKASTDVIRRDTDLDTLQNATHLCTSGCIFWMDFANTRWPVGFNSAPGTLLVVAPDVQVPSSWQDVIWFAGYDLLQNSAIQTKDMTPRAIHDRRDYAIAGKLNTFFLILPWFFSCHVVRLLCPLRDHCGYWLSQWKTTLHLGPLSTTWFNFSPGMDR